jgi:hypothetical protein
MITIGSQIERLASIKNPALLSRRSALEPGKSEPLASPGSLRFARGSDFPDPRAKLLFGDEASFEMRGSLSDT